MISALIIDFSDHGAAPTVAQWLGVALVLMGVYAIRSRAVSAQRGGALAAGPRRLMAR